MKIGECGGGAGAAVRKRGGSAEAAAAAPVAAAAVAEKVLQPYLKDGLIDICRGLNKKLETIVYIHFKK